MWLLYIIKFTHPVSLLFLQIAKLGTCPASLTQTLSTSALSVAFEGWVEVRASTLNEVLCSIAIISHFPQDVIGAPCSFARILAAWLFVLAEQLTNLLLQA